MVSLDTLRRREKDAKAKKFYRKARKSALEKNLPPSQISGGFPKSDRVVNTARAERALSELKNLGYHAMMHPNDMLWNGAPNMAANVFGGAHRKKGLIFQPSVYYSAQFFNGGTLRVPKSDDRIVVNAGYT